MSHALRLMVGGLLAAFLFLVNPSWAGAQSSSRDMEARALFEAGRVAFVDERYDDALGYFQRAHELSNRPELLYNIAATLDRLDRETEALAQYEAYIAALPTAENRVEIDMRVRVLRERAAHTAATAGGGGSTTTTTPIRPIEPTEPREPEPTDTVVVDGPTETGGPAEGRTIRAGDPVDVAPSTGGDVTSEAWFWVAIGAVVVGAGVGITVGIVLSQDPGETAYIPGDGGVIMTLTGALP